MDDLKYYSYLNVSPDATPKEIKDNYYRFSRSLHPDKQPEHMRKAATEQFAKIEEAKDVLLDPARRYAYDNYGQVGVEMLHQHSSDFLYEHLNLNNYKDQTVILTQRFNSKLQKLIRKTNDQILQSEVNHRSTAIINLSIADYFDSFRTEWQGKGKEPWRPVVQLYSFQLQELVKLNLSSRLTGDLGYMIYTKGGFGVGTISPRVGCALGNGYVGQIALQVGDRNSATIGLSKTFNAET